MSSFKFTADFETTTDEHDCRVWACGICDIESLNFFYGNNIEWFFNFAHECENATFYFHNLKFDGAFIIDYLLRRDYKHTDRKAMFSKSFSTLISDTNNFYIIEIMFSDGVKIKIYDSLKIIPFPVKNVAKTFGLPIRKGEIDYHKHRPIGYCLDSNEISYLKNDCEIMARALTILFEQGLTKITQGSNALHDYKKTLKRDFKKTFPPPTYDSDIRQAYKGGYTYANPEFQGRDIKEHGIVLDKNSMYPWVMRTKLLPFGEGVFFDGEYVYDELYPLYIQMIRCQFATYPDKLPTIQIKGGSYGFMPTEYVVDSGDEEVVLCLTNIDLKLFLEHYDTTNLEYLSGWKFMGTTDLFSDYIDKWYNVKVEASRTKNAGLRSLSKLMLNAIYGKFALNPNVRSKIPYLDEESNIVKYSLGPKETREPIYVPMATFITSYAREEVIRSAQKVKHRFLYCDTDSLHLIGTELPNLWVDDFELGAWKIENTFVRARFLRAKSYIELLKTKAKKDHELKVNFAQRKFKLSRHNYNKKYIACQLNVTCAGMPKACHKFVSYDNFVFGSEFEGKKQATVVPGGVILKDKPFTLKP